MCVCVVGGGLSGDCLRFIAWPLRSGGVHFTSYFQPRETSSEKATGGLTQCCTFKGQIAHIYATACHCQEEWLLPRRSRRLCVFTCVCARVCAKGGKSTGQRWKGISSAVFYFVLFPSQFCLIWFCHCFKGYFDSVKKKKIHNGTKWSLTYNYGQQAALSQVLDCLVSGITQKCCSLLDVIFWDIFKEKFTAGGLWGRAVLCSPTSWVSDCQFFYWILV